MKFSGQIKLSNKIMLSLKLVTSILQILVGIQKTKQHPDT